MRVLLIDIDSLRADHLGCYGYDRNTSPTIDDLSSRGVTFENCFVSDSPCLPSRSAMATCRHGIKSGVVTHWGPGQWYDDPGDGHSPDPDRVTSFRHLWENGIRTASISSFASNHLATHFSGAFQEAIQPTAKIGGLDDGRDVTREATDWLERHAEEDDWLLHVNYWDVHHPYTDVDEHVEGIRSSGPAPEWPDEEQIAEHRRATGSRTASVWPLADEYGTDEYEDGYWQVEGYWPMPIQFGGREDFEHVVDAYDASIRKIDAYLSGLLETLERQGVREETTVVLTADHGEAFGEHGIYADHAMAHEPCQRVPLIVSGGAASGNDRVESSVYQFDLMATLCDLAGLSIPEGWDARPFTPALRGETIEGREYVVAGHGNYIYSRAVYADEWAYVRIIHPGVFSNPGVFNDPSLPDGGMELLYRLDDDRPGNVVEEFPDVAEELAAVLDRWTVSMLEERDTNARDPLVETAIEKGPFLYVDPESLSMLADEHGIALSEQQRAAIDRSRSFPNGAIE